MKIGLYGMERYGDWHLLNWKELGRKR